MWTDAFQIVIITAGLLTLLIKGVQEVGSIEIVLQRVKDGGRMPYFELVCLSLQFLLLCGKCCC